MHEFSKSPTPCIPLGYKQPGILLHPSTSTVSNVAIDPITLMINDCMTISSAMRKMTRWSQSGVAAILGAGDIFGENDSITNLGLSTNMANNGSSRSTGINDNPLLSSFLQLRSMLTDAKDLYEIDSLTLLQPFLLVIKSSSTSGNITSLALNSISKFISYEIISFKSKNLQSSLIQIISALTHCRFEAADQSSDDAVLLKVLRLMEDILESPLSKLLPNEVISEVVQTCLSLACNKKRSEVLRKAAEMAMTLITSHIFRQLKDIEPETVGIDDLQTNFSKTQLPEDLIGGTETTTSILKEEEEEVTNRNIEDKKTEDGQLDENTVEENDQPVENPREISNSENPKEALDTEEPFGIICINEFLGILISMISPSNQYQHMESTRVFALSLMNTAIEVSGHDIPKHPSLMSLVSDPVSKHVVQIMTTTDSPALLQASLQLFSTIAIVLGRQLKSQIELTLLLLFNSISPDSVEKNDTINGNETSVATRISGSKEMLIESLSLLWTRSPVFFTHLFIDYDCNFDRTDLSRKFLEFLCKLSLPESAVLTTDNVPPICLEGILTFIGGINDRIKSLPIDKELSDLQLHSLILDKYKKTTFISCTDILNNKPKAGIKELAEKGFINDENDADELAHFFFSKSGRLNKKVLGEYLAKPSNIEILRKFINMFEFTGLRVDEALRVLLKSFRLPGESQQIERVVELFAERYVHCQENVVSDSEEEAVKPDRDAVFVLSYSVIMLNTDLHNPKVRHQMDLDAYKRNLRGVYNGKDFPSWYLSKIYHSIKEREIIMPEEHHGTDKWFDDAWHNLISSEAVNIDKDETLEFDNVQLCQFDKVLFEGSVDRIIDTLISVFKEASDDQIITRLMSSVDKCANICLYYNLSSSIDKLVGLLAELTTLTSEIHHVPSADDNVREEIPITQIKVEKKDEAITVSEMAVWFGRDFKAQISTVVLFRLIKKTDFKVTESWNKIIKIILTLFENCLINPNFFTEFQKKIKLNPLAKVKPRYIINRIKPLKDSGIFSTFSSFLKGYSDDPPEPTDQEVESTLSTIDCVKSLNIPSIFEHISKGPKDNLKLFIELLLDSIPTFKEETKRYFEIENLFLFEIMVCFCLLLDDTSITNSTLDKITYFGGLKDLSRKGNLRVCAYKLLLIRHSDGSHESTLTECIKELSEFDKELISKHGAQLAQPLISLVDDESWFCKKLVNNEEYWKALRIFGSIPIYSSDVLRFVDGIILNSPMEVSPLNYMPLLGLLDEISSLGAAGSQWEQETEQLAVSGQKQEDDNSYYRDLVEISKKSISLTAELNSISKRPEFNQKDLSYSLIQALAHQCFNPCREVRTYAINTLQLTVLSSEINDKFTPAGIFEYGLFPLLSELSKNEVLQTDPNGFARTQTEALSLVSKVFLKYESQFDLEGTDKIWLGILEYFIVFNSLGEKFNMNENLIKESGGELLKNMILVLQNNGILTDSKTELWKTSWEKIEQVYPNLKDELALENSSKVEEGSSVNDDKLNKEQDIEQNHEASKEQNEKQNEVSQKESKKESTEESNEDPKEELKVPEEERHERR